jgi:hypothetical protein
VAGMSNLANPSDLTVTSSKFSDDTEQIVELNRAIALALHQYSQPRRPTTRQIRAIAGLQDFEY